MKMRQTKKTEADLDRERIIKVLQPYLKEHPRAQLAVHRQNNAILKVRIIDPDFQEMDRVQREDVIWKYFDSLPEDTMNQIMIVLLITPKETKRSMANMDFEDSLAGKNWW